MDSLQNFLSVFKKKQQTDKDRKYSVNTTPVQRPLVD